MGERIGIRVDAGREIEPGFWGLRVGPPRGRKIAAMLRQEQFQQLGTGNLTMDLAATLKLAAFAVAIEACIGYPQGLFRAIGHPVTWTGRLIGLADGRLNHDDRSFATRRALGFATLLLLLSIAGGGAYLFSLELAGLELPQPASLA